MKVVFKKNESVISVKVGIAWSFWFAFIFPWVGAYSGQRDRSFWSIVTAAHGMMLRG